MLKMNSYVTMCVSLIYIKFIINIINKLLTSLNSNYIVNDTIVNVNNTTNLVCAGTNLVCVGYVTYLCLPTRAVSHGIKLGLASLSVLI